MFFYKSRCHNNSFKNSAKPSSFIKEVPRVLEDPENYDARVNIMWAGTMAHNNICGVGREQDWNSHGLEHELSGLYDIAHGAGLAVMMPAWMKFVMQHNVTRFAQMAVRVFGAAIQAEIFFLISSV